jgi:hypothetical protein
MATKVYETIELELLDGTIVTVKPLNLKNLRAVMKEWSKTAGIENEDEFIDILVACTKISLKQLAPSLLEPEDVVEEVIDLQTMYKILEIAAEIKLNDPNLLAAAQGVLGTN